MRPLLAAAALALTAFSAEAAVLTGDTLTRSFAGDTATVAVATGYDDSVFGFNLDYDFGPGTQFTFDASSTALSFQGANSLELTGLSFSDGEVLTGFSIIDTALSGVSWSLTASSILFTWTYQPQTVVSGAQIWGSFLTGPAPAGASDVPLPAAAPLALGALGLLGVIGRRRG